MCRHVAHPVPSTRSTPRRSRCAGVVALTVAALASTSCAAYGPDRPASAERAATSDAAAPTPEDGAAVSVSTAFYPLAWVTEQVGGDRVAVRDLTPPGSNEHDLELSPTTVDAMSRADLTVYLAGFQPAVDDAVATIGAGVPAYDVAADAHLLPAAGGGADEHDHADHGGDAGTTDDADGTDHSGHDHGAELAGLDPHFWLDPARLADVALALGDQLAAVDPEGAEEYRANAKETSAELDDLAARIDDGLARCERTHIVVTHEAYGYLTEPRGIEMIGIAGVDPDAEPSPAHIARIEQAVAGTDATTVFAEESVDSTVAEVVAGQTGLTIDRLDPLGSRLTDESTYPGQMASNLDALRAALDCA